VTPFCSAHTHTHTHTQQAHNCLTLCGDQSTLVLNRTLSSILLGKRSIREYATDNHIARLLERLVDKNKNHLQKMAARTVDKPYNLNNQFGGPETGVARNNSTFETALLDNSMNDGTDKAKQCFGMSRTTFCCGCFWFNVALWLPLWLLVIIPAIMQSLVNHSDLTINSVTIMNPTSTSFTAINYQTFSNAGSITANAKTSYLNINWNTPSGGHMVQLGESNSFQVKNNKQVQMTSTATITDATAFANFNTAAITNESLTWQLQGVVDVTFVVTAKCNINKNIEVIGFGNFQTPPNVTKVNTTGGTAFVLNNLITATMTSTSDISIDFGQTMHFLLLSEGIQIGIGSIPNYNMIAGVSTVQAEMALSFSNELEKEQLMRVLSNYSNGFTSSVTMANFYTETPITWLAPALNTISMDTVMPAAPSRFVVNVTLCNPVDPEKGVPFDMLLYNPIDTDTIITHIEGNFSYHGQVFGTISTEADIHLQSGKMTHSGKMLAFPAGGVKGDIAYEKLVCLSNNNDQYRLLITLFMFVRLRLQMAPLASTTSSK
jgi:hypothetical protein